MARYDVRVVALALDVPYPWLDTTLARIEVPGVTRRGHGVRRSATEHAVVVIGLALELVRELGVGMERGVAVAQTLAGEAAGGLQMGLVTLSVDVLQFQRQIHLRLQEAVERAVPVRRGRPSASAPKSP
jgi:hypothetical protein